MAGHSQRFDGRVVLVTGAASGIGRETARRVAAEGGIVCMTDRDEAGACRASQETVGGERAHSVMRLDVSQESDWESAIDQVINRHGRLDAIVHCAGISAASPLEETPLSQWREVFSVNVEGAFLATKHGMRAMRANGGCIVHVSSASGVMAAAGACAYSVSKAAVHMLAKAAAKECRDRGIPVRVNSVSPGAVRTPMWRTMPFFQELISATGSEEAAFESIAGDTPGGIAEPKDVVSAILFLISDEARHIHGVDLVVDGGFVL